MSNEQEQVAVRDNQAAQRYEVDVDGAVAVLEYEREDGRIDLIHTEVPPALGGRGIAARLAHTALEDAQAAGLKVIPSCSYVASYIRRHPEYLPLVAEPYREELTEGK